MAQTYWGIMLAVCGKIKLRHKHTVKSWKYFKCDSKLESKYLSKFRKATKPICVGEPGVFEIKRLTVLKFFRGIIKGTFRALLTIGKD